MTESDNGKPRELMAYLPTDIVDWVYAHVEGIGDMLFQKVGTSTETRIVKCRYPSRIVVEQDKKEGIRITVGKFLFAALGIIEDVVEIRESRIVCVGTPTAKAISMALSEWKPPLIKIVKPGEMNRLKELGGEGVN